MLRRGAIITMSVALSLLVAEPIFFANVALAQPSDSPADYVPRDMTDLEQLTAPVALYPDAILAQVLVACSYPDDVISAAQWLNAGNDPQGIDDQDWDLSVKGVARYPSALNYMASHVDWMNDLGDAFVNQESDVMTSVQLLRAQANAAGNLVSNDQQQVVIDGDVVEIIPADPQVIYVPQYDPQVVYVERRRFVGERWEPLVSFGVGIRVGDWLRHDCDWHDHAVYVGDWGRDRPWWHRDDQRGGEPGHRYADYRPGTYRSTNITNITNTTVINRTDVRNNVTHVAQNGRWQRDSRKPAPRPASRTVNRAPNLRSGTGYPPARLAAERIASEPAPPSNVAVPQEARGAVTAKASSRGQRSRQSTVQSTPQPAARPAPAPVAARPAAPAQPAARPEPAPRAAKPAHAAPAPRPAPAARPAPTPPAARPSAPTRGGAMGGYQNGSEASRSSDRGAKSRDSSQPKDHR
jgi:hypothetical protein